MKKKYIHEDYKRYKKKVHQLFIWTSSEGKNKKQLSQLWKLNSDKSQQLCKWNNSWNKDVKELVNEKGNKRPDCLYLLISYNLHFILT